LVAFANHPFSLYDGQRFADMVESVRTDGVMVPIIVRPSFKDEDNTKFSPATTGVPPQKKQRLKKFLQ